MNTGSCGTFAKCTKTHQDARNGTKRPLKLAAVGSGLAAETTLSNRDFERIAASLGRKKLLASGAAYCGLSEPCPPRRRNNVAPHDILSTNSTVIEGR